MELNETTKECTSSCKLGGCAPCSYLALFLVIPYSLYVIASGHLFGLAFLAYGLIVSAPLIIKTWKGLMNRTSS